jgi:hypothetical protein
MLPPSCGMVSRISLRFEMCAIARRENTAQTSQKIPRKGRPRCETDLVCGVAPGRCTDASLVGLLEAYPQCPPGLALQFITVDLGPKQVGLPALLENCDENANKCQKPIDTA